MGATDDMGEHEALVREAFLETMGEGRVDAVADFFADTVAYYRSSGELAGRSGLEGDIEMFHAAFPNLDGDIHRSMAGDEKVSFLYTLTGSHEGEFEGIPPTHTEMEAKGAAIARVEDDEITEYRIVFDNLGMLEQLGVLGE
jgi:steroid delta-isomerase-like uncharacterized protein